MYYQNKRYLSQFARGAHVQMSFKNARSVKLASRGSFHLAQKSIDRPTPKSSLSHLVEGYWIPLATKLKRWFDRIIVSHPSLESSVPNIRHPKAIKRNLQPDTTFPIVAIEQNQRTSLLYHLYRPFPGKITISDRPHALSIARKDSLILDPSRFVLWTDAAHVPSHASIGVAWRTPFVWETVQQGLSEQYTNHEAELLAIAASIKVATRMIHDTRESVPIKAITIYSDSKTALAILESFHRLKKGEHGSILNQLELARVKERVQALRSRGVPVELRWVPGHSQILGNVQAHNAAKSQLYSDPQTGDLQVDPIGFLDSRAAALATTFLKSAPKVPGLSPQSKRKAASALHRSLIKSAKLGAASSR